MARTSDDALVIAVVAAGGVAAGAFVDGDGDAAGGGALFTAGWR